MKNCNRIFIILIIFTASCTANQGGVGSSFSEDYALQTEKEAWEKVPEILSRINPPLFAKSTFPVMDFGAKGDSLTDDRPAFLQAIAACSQSGGGTVVVSPGQYFIKGPLHLKSNVHILLEEGSRIFFSQQPKDYLPAVKVRWEGTVCYNYSPLIYGYRLQNVAITGKGMMDGAAKEWSMEWRKVQKPDKDRLRQMGNDVIPEVQRVFGNGFLDLDGDGEDDGYGDGQPHYLRPTLIELYDCENILLEDLTIKESPFWTVHPVFSKNITVRNLKVSGSVLNDDGVDPDSCEDVLIEGCEIQTRDDAISIKAGRDQDAWNRPGSRNIVVRKNRLLSGANALCIGSEMSGGVSNVFAIGNYIANGQHALNFKCNLDRGGQVEKIFIKDTEIASCKDAMFIFRMDYHGYRGNNFPTKFNDFYVTNIQCRSVEKKPFKIVGVEAEPIERIMLNNVTVDSVGEESEIAFARDLIFRNVTIGGIRFKP